MYYPRGQREPTKFVLDAVAVQVPQQLGAATLRKFVSFLLKINEDRLEDFEYSTDFDRISPVDRMIVLLDQGSTRTGHGRDKVLVTDYIFSAEGIRNVSVR